MNDLINSLNECNVKSKIFTLREWKQEHLEIESMFLMGLLDMSKLLAWKEALGLFYEYVKQNGMYDYSVELEKILKIKEPFKFVEYALKFNERVIKVMIEEKEKYERD